MKSAHDMPFGAALTPDGARFAIWAPSADGAEVEVDGRRVPMQRGAQGFFHCFDTQAGPGSRYAFRFAGGDLKVPDPASRFNPDGVHERFFTAASERLGPERARDLDALIGNLEQSGSAAELGRLTRRG